MIFPLLSQRHLSVFALAVALLVSGISLDGAQTVYRYRAFVGTEAPPTCSDYRASVSRLPEVATIPRGGEGGPFKGFAYARFTGEEVYASTAVAEPGIPAGDFSITAHLNLHPEGLDPSGQVQTIVSLMDPLEKSGFNLAVVDGQLEASTWLQTESGIVNRITLASEAALQPGHWYRIVFRYHRSRDGSTHFKDLWVNENQVALRTLHSTLSRPDGVQAPVVGAEPMPGGGFKDFLHADVFAVQVDDYPLDTFFLETPLVRDGSAYFGMFGSHDYLGLQDQAGKQGGKPLERRIVETFFDPDTGETRYGELDRRLNGLWFLPFLNDDYIPQGLAIDPEKGRVFLAYYHKTRDNVTRTHPSIIAEVFIPEGRLGHVFTLHDENNQPMTSHMGGIAYWNGYLLAPSTGSSETMDPDLFVYDIREQASAAFDPDKLEGFSEVRLRAVKRFRDPLAILGPDGRFNSLSFMGVHYNAAKEPYLHLGNFQHEPRPTHLFKLEEDASTGSRELLIKDPVTVIQSHRRAQGMHFFFDAFVETRQVRRAFLSNSWGDNDSTLYSSLYTGDPEPAVAGEFLRLPAGLEDLGRVGNTLLTWSESGAVYFQKRTNPWKQLFPFLMAIDIADRIDASGNGIPDEWLAHHGLAFDVDPSSDADEDGFSVYKEYIWDTNPRAALDYPQIYPFSGLPEIILKTSVTRFYTLQKSDDLIDWQVVPEIDHLRGNNDLIHFSPESPELNTYYRVLIEDD